MTDEKLIEAMVEAITGVARAALAVVRREEGWRDDMAAGRAFGGDVLLLLANGAVIRARYDGGLVAEDGSDAWGWQASIEGVHPPCWDDGICWASNADEEPSIQPVAWMPLPPPPEQEPSL